MQADDGIPGVLTAAAQICGGEDGTVRQNFQTRISAVPVAEMGIGDMVKQFQHPLARRLIFEILPAADPTAEVAVTWGGFIHAAECGDDPAVRQIAGDMAVTFERQRQRQRSTPASAMIVGKDHHGVHFPVVCPHQAGPAGTVGGGENPRFTEVCSLQVGDDFRLAPASAAVTGEGTDDQILFPVSGSGSGIGERNERMIRHLETGGSMSTA